MLDGWCIAEQDLALKHTAADLVVDDAFDEATVEERPLLGLSEMRECYFSKREESSGVSVVVFVWLLQTRVEVHHTAVDAAGILLVADV